MIRWLSLPLAFGLISLAPLAKADVWDQRTIVTFNQPVEIPGRVLPAGTYVMKLLNSPSDRTIVQFFNKDETKLIDTVMAIADYRVEPTGKTVITFAERRGDSPEALHSWFYPGDEYGVEFVYPHQNSMMLASNQKSARPQPQYTATPAPAPAKNTTAQNQPAPQPVQSKPAPAPQQPKQMAMATPPPAPAPAPAPQQQAKPAPKELPKTASDLPLTALLATITMGLGIAVRKLTA